MFPVKLCFELNFSSSFEPLAKSLFFVTHFSVEVSEELERFWDNFDESILVFTDVDNKLEEVVEDDKNRGFNKSALGETSIAITTSFSFLL